MSGAIPRGWPGAGRRFIVEFDENGYGITDEEVTNYLTKMGSTGIRMDSAFEGDKSTTRELPIQVW